MTNRQAINKFRKDLNERNADSGYTNQYLYNSLMVHAKWLIKREASRIYGNTSLFQMLSPREIMAVSNVPDSVSIKTNVKIYRTKNKIPEIWQDSFGPIIKSISSLDRSTSFMLISFSEWFNKIQNPYQKYSKEKYCIFEDGYLWFPKDNPHKIIMTAYFKDNVVGKHEECEDCEEGDCKKFLDAEFRMPEWIEGELFAKALEQVAGITKRLPEDAQIDKNVNRKN